jgi:hypothetical protein
VAQGAVGREADGLPAGRYWPGGRWTARADVLFIIPTLCSRGHARRCSWHPGPPVPPLMTVPVPMDGARSGPPRGRHPPLMLKYAPTRLYTGPPMGLRDVRGLPSAENMAGARGPHRWTA